MRLSKRLETIAGFVTPGNTLADVGCDHGYLAIYLAENHLVHSAIVSDIRPGPLSRAEQHIKEYHLEDRITARLSDGLHGFSPGEAQTLVIAGMGGPLMEKILSECLFTALSFEELILEPQSDVPHFRRFLLENGFSVRKEEMVREEGKYYPVLLAAAGREEEPWDDVELAFGKHLLERKHPVLKEYLEREAVINSRILQQLTQEESPSARIRKKEMEEKKQRILEALQRISKQTVLSDGGFAVGRNTGGGKICFLKQKGESMAEQKELTVTVGADSKSFLPGTAFGEIVKEFMGESWREVLLVLEDGRLRELCKKLKRDCRLEFITNKDTIGYQTYKRTAVFILLKAIYDVGGKKSIDKVVIHYSIGNALYFTMEGTALLDESFLERVKERMRELVQGDVPVIKRNIRTDDAISLFHRHHMYDKEKLFHYRMSSRVNIYSIENFDDYFYGYMASSTGFITTFDLQLYEEGFILLLPDKGVSGTLSPFVPRDKLFHVMKESQEWVDKLRVATVGELNGRVTKGEIQEIILAQEALHEARISAIAQEILERGDVKFVMIAGPSSSGKTTFSHRLSIQLSSRGLRPHPIAVDNYFVDREKTPLDEFGERDYECLEALDLVQFEADMNALISGKRVQLPTFNFVTGTREYNGENLLLGKEDILVIEGIHGLNPDFGRNLPEESKFRIYISALTQLNIDEHNRIPTTDGRLIRRIVRDARTRGNTAEATISKWPSVRRGEEKNIFPYQEKADVMFNSALVYELACLKVYAEPLLFGISRDSPQYMEAKRLLKFLGYFVPFPDNDIPNNSLLREFLGGSCFKV